MRPGRATSLDSASEPQLRKRIRLVAKLDVRRSGPGAARYAYKWQSAWENPTPQSYHGWCAVPGRGVEHARSQDHRIVGTLRLRLVLFDDLGDLGDNAAVFANHTGRSALRSTT
jgi:hypothetical protein